MVGRVYRSTVTATDWRYTMNPTPLVRACLATKLPRGLFTDQGGLYLKDSEIRANLRQQHVATERFVLALADLFNYDLRDSLWPLASGIAKRHDLPASMVGALAFATMLPEDGAVHPDAWGVFVWDAP